MIIDSHQHFWDPLRGDYGWLEPGSPLHRRFWPDDLQPLLRQSGVNGTILVQAAATAAESDYLLRLARARPWVLGVIGWIDLAAVDASAHIVARSREPRFVGLRPMLQDLPDPRWILQPELALALETARTTGLVFDALIKWRQLRIIIELAERYPTLSIVLDHAGKPPFGDDLAWNDWRAHIHELAKRPNVACKLSGLLTELPSSGERHGVDQCVAHVLREFGPERVMWGSDWPVATLAVSYAAWLQYCQTQIRQLCPTHEELVFGGNARRIYGLSI